MAKKKSTTSRSTANSTSMDTDNISTTARSRRSVTPVMDESEEISETPRRASRSMSGSGNKNVWKDLISNPAVRYVAGGIATAILTKVASNFSTKYPEISRFITENLDGVEGRLGEFKNSLSNDSQVNRH